MQGGFQLIISILVAGILSGVLALRCNREPENTHTPKTVDNRFIIKISGNPDKYVPGGIYTVSLNGQRIGRLRPTFKRFMLVVEPSYSYLSSWENSIFGNRNVGSFALVGDTLAKYSHHCPNAIIQTSSLKKSQIQATWTAPPPGSGCVVFRATVVEDHDVWYMDDGPLSLILCEDVQENDGNQLEFVFPCCACADALYEMTFEGQWSKPTHPKEFPSNEWLTAFSDLIGASHSADYRFWEYGNFASEGLRQVAEFGATHLLENEIMAKSELVRTIIKARGLTYPNVTGKTYAVFRADTKNHLVSVVSMIDPSPDWIVGISGFNLCLNDCSWVDNRVLNLYPWDVGTDNGITYTSPDAPTSPHQTISRITSSYPNDPRSPFYDPSGIEVQPLARLYLTRQKIFEKECGNKEFDSKEGSEPEGLPADCAVSEWSEWSYCSVTCGKGVKHRQRSYLNNMNAHFMTCNEVLLESSPCFATEQICSPQENERFDDPICALTEWSSWSSCSVSCGIGEQSRTRRYKTKQGLRHCSHEPNAPVRQQIIACEGSEEAICDEYSEVNPDDCPGTKWSAWSPCSASCGKGKILRKRIPIDEEPTDDPDNSNLSMECTDMHLVEEKDCTADLISCEITPKMYRELCLAPMVEGSCYRNNSRWFYNAENDTCEEFIYRGCLGNRNNYLTKTECENTCKGYEMPEGEEEIVEETTAMNGPFNGMLPSSHILDLNATAYGLLVSTVPTFTIDDGVDGPVVDCVVTRWTPWSECSVTCGGGYRQRSRTIQVHPMNGGRACPKKLYKKRKCGRRKCDSENEDEVHNGRQYKN